MIKKFYQYINENNQEGFETIKNEIDPQTPVIVIYPSYEKFDVFKTQFDQLGHAFYSVEQNIIFLDQRIMIEDWYTDNHLYVIESHEYGHKLAKHQHSNDSQSEKEADYIGYHILQKRGLKEASDILYDLFYDRYVIEIEEFKPTNGVMDIIGNI